jgi:hypothetical protein
VRAGGAWGADLRPLGEYAMLNALAPKAEDMIVGAVAAAR